MSNISHTASKSSFGWDQILETASRNENLTAQLKVTEDSVSALKKSSWDSMKSFFNFKTPSSTSAETLENLKMHLHTYFGKEVSLLCIEIGCDNEKAQELGDRFLAFLQTITSQLEKDLKTNSSTSAAIQKADIGISQALHALREGYAMPEQAPQIKPIFKEGKLTEYVVIQPASPFENMVLAGGGAKGKTYSVVLQALEKVGVRKSLKTVAGSSAGAMAAAGFACGMDSKSFAKFAEELNADKLFTPSKNFIFNQLVSFSPNSIGFEATNIIELINKAISKPIREFLAHASEEELQKLSMQSFSAIKQLQENVKNKSFVITFRHLALVREMDPEKFKDLLVTGFNKETGKEVYYNATNTPDIPIAEAARISAALPIFFKPVESIGGTLEDGGIGSNIPVEALDSDFNNLDKKVKASNPSDNEDLLKTLVDPENTILPKDVTAHNARAKTVVLGFDNNGAFSKITANSQLFVTKNIEKNIEAFVTGNSDYRFSSMADNIKLWNAGSNAIDVYHGTLNTTSFVPVPGELEAAKNQANTSIWRYLRARQNQATYEVFPNLETALASLDQKGLFAILKSIPDEIKTIQDNPEISLEEKGHLVQETQERLSAILKLMSDEMLKMIQDDPTVSDEIKELTEKEDINRTWIDVPTSDRERTKADSY